MRILFTERAARIASLILFLGQLTFLAAVAAPVENTQTIVAFDAANKLYEQGRFPEAAAAYQQLIETNTGSLNLYFNLGNARFKDGKIGRAIAAYRQAERLAPRDPNVQFNLNFARKRVTSGEPPPERFLDRIVSALTLNEWTGLAIAAFWAVFLLLAVGELRESFRATARRYAFVAAAASLLLGAGAANAARQWFHPTDGVVAVPDVIVRSGPLEEARELYQFRDGTEVKLLDQKRAANGSAWFQVRNRAGQSGWVKDDQLAVIR